MQTTYNPFNPPILRPTDHRVHWHGLQGASASLAISQLAKQQPAVYLLITADIHQARILENELLFFNQQDPITILNLPDWETLPYDHFSPHQDLISQRLLTLSKIPLMKQGMIIAALSTLFTRLAPQNYLQAHTLNLSQNDSLDYNIFRQQLIEAGYFAVNQVMEHGEFAIRGSIMDIFPMGSALPYRIELFDEQIESIRSFNPETQCSIEKINKICLLPAREYPLDEAGVTQFRQTWRALFSGNPLESPIYQNISNYQPAAGVEYYLPLFFEKTQTIFDFIPKNTKIILNENLNNVADQHWQEIKNRYEQLRYDLQKPLCKPDQVFIPPEQFFAYIKEFQSIQLNNKEMIKAGHYQFSTPIPPQLEIDHKAKQPLQALENFINQQPQRILFSADSTGRREILRELLNNSAIYPTNFSSWADFLASKESLGICVANLEQGLWLPEQKLALICETQLVGKQVLQTRLRKSRSQDPNTMVRNLTELNIGSPVVHIDHGIGRYLGLQRIKTGEIEAEYLTLQYADNDKIYVPVTSLHLIHRYTGMDPDHAPLHKLGSKKWQVAKQKAAEKVKDVAAELLDIYSRRQASTGHEFKKPDIEYQRFRSAFPFEETPDQEKAINEVITDMTSQRCMDRLICGDVGFGKTEVAMQAAFLATQDNKQVAVLVPTTLLATQHLHSFQDRFSDYPIKIALLSRSVSSEEQKKILNELKNGTIDIVIGTHKLLGSQIQFKDLGLLIIDEEHRFGVQQKERIKSLRAHVDILTLTATPIPRTLNGALAGSRDLSIIGTPPAQRLSIKTFVHDRQPAIIREATLREIMRGGQIYFLHNEVATITAMADQLQEIIPEARVGIAHGQMRERILEKIMADFYHQKFNLLLCTTIVESGIDVPTANTIIINNADRFGLAQLHQLRGRVGRSHHQAYAYLLITPEKKITKDAEKRLEVITQLEDLGAGFQLATHDLEIRGAGELLGEEQSGHIQTIGFSLYMELLEETVNALRNGTQPTLNKSLHQGPEINLQISALIPEILVPDVQIRLTLYKRLANCTTENEIQQLKAEMIDRFGLLPEVTQQLFALAQLKLRIAQLGIQKIDANPQFIYLHFSEKPQINLRKIVDLLQKHPKQYQMHSAQTLRLKFSTSIANERITIINKLLNDLE